ncbi:MAG: 2-C-methyl-D-erythritol 2,4-cyclodiphosphate synthase [Magnetococcales bacterium]|nr:2-C-methyl-D-erythritol 2,4-cyclodiphosphate synthase [Magnetococcales bacterium]
MNIRVGQGFDVHRWIDGRPLMLGGVHIPHHQGLLGHSDADVLIHALMDALLGAAGLGDIGQHFPDSDSRYKGIDSCKLMAHVHALLKERGYRPVNLDSTIICQKPKLAPFMPQMRRILADILEITPDEINIKATTTEKLGFTGRNEGVAAMATVLIQRVADSDATL